VPAELTPEEKASRAFLNIVFVNMPQYQWPHTGQANVHGHANEHLRGTPMRFVSMLREMTTPDQFDFTTFESTSDEMVIIKDIAFSSLCAHHIIPFVGVAHVGYVPKGKIAGLSKIARLVKNLSKALTVQEELTYRIAGQLHGFLDPAGVAVVMEAEHMCMTIRGVQSPGTKTITSRMTGVFADHDRQARNEFLQLIGKG
jgi:GTP cyclohydrolase I